MVEVPLPTLAEIFGHGCVVKCSPVEHVRLLDFVGIERELVWLGYESWSLSDGWIEGGPEGR